jgi:hypothetical protein
MRAIRGEFFAGDIGTSRSLIAADIAKHPGEANVLKLDQAVVELTAGRPQAAEQLLREVRDSFDYLDQTSAGEVALATMTDDTATSYSGEDYEKLLIRVFLCFSNLMGAGGDASAYSLQVGDVQQRIIEAGMDKASGQNPKLAYKRLAIGPYLFGAIREESFMNHDDVVRCSATVAEWEPSFRYAMNDVERAQNGRHSQKGNGVVYVFALVGRGPYKEQFAEMPSTVSLLVADRILSATGKHTLPPTIAPVKVPKVVVAASNTQNIEVVVDRRSLGTTETIADVGRMAVDQYAAIYPQVIGRAVARRVIKKGVVYAGKEAMRVGNNSLANVALDVGGIAWEATEQADTRCWALLPDRIQVLRVEVPAGEHELVLRPVSRWQTAAAGQARKISVADGRNTYVIANFPDNQLVGAISTSR